MQGHHSTLTHATNVDLFLNWYTIGFFIMFPKLNLFLNMLVDDLIALSNLIEVKYLICRFSEPVQRAEIIPRVTRGLIDCDPSLGCLDYLHSTATIDSRITMLPERHVLLSCASQSMHPDEGTFRLVDTQSDAVISMSDYIWFYSHKK